EEEGGSVAAGFGAASWGAWGVGATDLKAEGGRRKTDGHGLTRTGHGLPRLDPHPDPSHRPRRPGAGAADPQAGLTKTHVLISVFPGEPVARKRRSDGGLLAGKRPPLPLFAGPRCENGTRSFVFPLWELGFFAVRGGSNLRAKAITGRWF